MDWWSRYEGCMEAEVPALDYDVFLSADLVIVRHKHLRFRQIAVALLPSGVMVSTPTGNRVPKH